MGYTPNIFQTQYGKLPPKNLEYPIFKQPQMEATPDTPVGLCIQTTKRLRIALGLKSTDTIILDHPN
jgi:hypothetical protein